MSRDDWKDRELIWKARSIIRAERRRQNPELEKLATYGQESLALEGLEPHGNGLQLMTHRNAND